MKKIAGIIVTVLLVIGLIVGAGFLANERAQYRKITVDANVGKQVVMVMHEGDKEAKDALNMKIVQLGDKITVTYEGNIFIGTKEKAGKDFSGLTISGVEELKDGTYVVIDTVVVELVNIVPDTIAPTPNK